MFFSLVFWAASIFFFNLDLYLFLSLFYGMQVYSFAAIPVILFFFGLEICWDIVLCLGLFW